MANECKKFALFACCLMTMQALRLVISTAGFCVVRFHIDPELFNIFISRLVNAVMMAQLFGNWLGDIIVFAASGQLKVYAIALANWIEFFCFCSALTCFCAGEQGKLTGFYWSMVVAYFWWKVGEAPAISVGGNEVDWYFAGFTLSGVWAAFLKSVVMIFIVQEKGVHSDALGEVNVTVVGDVSVVGARSVKTTVDYRAAKLLFAVTIIVAFLMCLVWEVAQVTKDDGRSWIFGEFVANAGKKGEGKASGPTDNNLVNGIKVANGKEVNAGSATQKAELNFTNATVNKDGTDVKAVGEDKIEIKVTGVTKTSGNGQGAIQSNGAETQATEKAVKKKLEGLVGDDRIEKVELSGTVPQATGPVTDLKITVTVKKAGWIVGEAWNAMLLRTAVVVAAIMAVPGAAMFGWIWRRKWFAVLGGLLVGLSVWMIFMAVVANVKEVMTKTTSGGTEDTWVRCRRGEQWVSPFKWTAPETNLTTWAAVIGLASGLSLGALVGLWIGACTGSKVSRFLVAVVIGSFFGLWTGEIANGVVTVKEAKTRDGATEWKNFMGKKNKPVVVSFGFFIVVFGCGTVYSVYPGMAPCSITQFKYFNIIDIWILILSAMAPIVIMGVDLAEAEWRLGITILGADGDWDFGSEEGQRMWGAVGVAVLMTIATLICEIIVLNIMQHPFSKTARKVTNSGWRACTLTILMVSFQLTSTGIGFGCVAAGSGFNDGIYNALSTSVLWTMECCGVLGEGYLTELKKYEPGKWPTQGMGKWDTYKWWNKKAFGNAWKIWCCIGTTDLRRDIMLCKQ